MTKEEAFDWLQHIVTSLRQLSESPAGRFVASVMVDTSENLRKAMLALREPDDALRKAGPIELREIRDFDTGRWLGDFKLSLRPEQITAWSVKDIIDFIEAVRRRLEE